MSVRNFLRDLLGASSLRTALRPPGAIEESDFVDRCIKCGQCAQVCPYDSIVMTHIPWGGKAGTPVIYAREVPCYVCMECPPVCPTGALDPGVRKKEQIEMGVAVIDESICLPFMGVICKACFEACPIYREAITLPDEIHPKVHEEHCIGCGICEHVCVAEVSAITVRPREYV